MDASLNLVEHTLSQQPQPSFAGWLPDVPTLLSTRLQLELLLKESQVDLHALSEVILADVGATLQIFRLIGEENPLEEDRPTRMEDCIASLNFERWYDLVCVSSMPQQEGLLAEWERWRRVALYARELARIVDGFAPEEAYLIGLLLNLAKLPQLLGWQRAGSAEEQLDLGLVLAEYWHLPRYLMDAIRELQHSVHSCRWTEMLQLAQSLADQSDPAHAS
jgi:HD-like signal output (HDOD) protein